MNLSTIQAAVKSSPNYRAKVGDMEIIGAPGRIRWTFDYVIRTTRENGKTRVAYGKRNAEDYARTLPNDATINTDITKFGGYTEPAQVAPIVEQAPRVVQCHNLAAFDFDGAPDNTVIVKTGKASNFRVVRHSPGIYIVHGRTEFVGGSTTVRGIDAVRKLLLTR